MCFHLGACFKVRVFILGILVFCWYSLFWSYLKAIVWCVYRKSGLLKKSKVFGSGSWCDVSLVFVLAFDMRCYYILYLIHTYSNIIHIIYYTLLFFLIYSPLLPSLPLQSFWFKVYVSAFGYPYLYSSSIQSFQTAIFLFFCSIF